MPMSSGGHAASSSGCATRPKVRESGSHGYAVPTQHSLPIGGYVMATAEHREPCDSRGSCTVLGAPGGEIPPGDSTKCEETYVELIIKYFSPGTNASSSHSCVKRRCACRTKTFFDLPVMDRA